MIYLPHRLSYMPWREYLLDVAEIIEFCEICYGPAVGEYRSIVQIIEIQDGSDMTYDWGDNRCQIQLVRKHGDKKEIIQSTAHEIFHTLSVSKNEQGNTNLSTVLEEGLASHFGETYAVLKLGTACGYGGSYMKSMEKVRKLIYDFPNCIKEIRKKTAIVSKITADDIIQYCPGVDRDLAQHLACPIDSVN